MRVKPYSSNTGTEKAAGDAMKPFGQRDFLVAVALILAIGGAWAVLSAQSETDKPENLRVFTTISRTVLATPEPDPLTMPSDVAVGPEGDIYVLDGVNHRVVVYDHEGQFQFQFGSQGSEPGQFHFPLGITTAPDGKIYVADSGNHRFQVFESNGKLLDAISLPDGLPETPPDPTDIAIDSNHGRLYIVDNDNHHVLVYNMSDRQFDSTWGSPGQGERQFRFPFFIDVSSEGYLFIVEPINTRVQVLNPNGKFVNFIGGWGVKAGQLFRPKGVAVYEDKIFVTDSYLGRVQVYHVRGGFLGMLADAAGIPLRFTTPTGITIDKKRKRLYVVELKANQVSRVDLE